MKQIDVLPDDVLLEIFDFYVNGEWYGGKSGKEAWISLVHVSRRWRSLVFRSPRRLNLRLYCSPETPAKDTLDLWPAFPLMICGDMSFSGAENVVTALRENNRVYEVYLWGIAARQLEEILTVMQVPFPELTDLDLNALNSNGDGETIPAIPDSFLGGSAPLLRNFTTYAIPFPGLSKLLSSAAANHLVELWLRSIPHSGYISPETMAAILSPLSGLERLSLEFESPQSHPGWESQSLPSPKRFILPALGEFHFNGVTEYLEDLVTRIDIPHLRSMDIHFFNQIDFHCPRLVQFMSRTSTLKALDEAHIQFGGGAGSVKLRYRESKSRVENLQITVLCQEPDWQLSSAEQVCSASLSLLSKVEDLYIEIGRAHV